MLLPVRPATMDRFENGATAKEKKLLDAALRSACDTGNHSRSKHQTLDNVRHFAHCTTAFVCWFNVSGFSPARTYHLVHPILVLCCLAYIDGNPAGPFRSAGRARAESACEKGIVRQRFRFPNRRQGIIAP